MLKAYKFRLYPTRQQEELINKHIGACRFAYNLALEVKQTAYIGYGKNLSMYDLMRQLTDLKNDLKWLNEVNSQSLQQSLVDLDSSYKAFFSGRSDFPKFKKKSHYGSFMARQGVFLNGNRLILPKFGKLGIKVVASRDVPDRISRVYLSKTSTGKYFASLVFDDGGTAPKKAKITENAIGIDLGISHFLTPSNGDKVDNPKFLDKSLSKLKYIQRKHSKHKGKKTRKKLSLLHERVANQRADFLHKTSTTLIKNHDSIVVETLDVKSMAKNNRLSRKISDAGWSAFITMLDYKSKWYGKNLIKIGQFEPSSKVCNNCGTINKTLKLSDREWICVCGSKHDRDINAAKNIRTIGLRNLSIGDRLKNHGELPTLVGALTYES